MDLEEARAEVTAGVEEKAVAVVGLVNTAEARVVMAETVAMVVASRVGVALAAMMVEVELPAVVLGIRLVGLEAMVASMVMAMAGVLEVRAAVRAAGSPSRSRATHYR